LRQYALLADGERPGVNTPQFTWVLSRLPSKAQPVPPFYQPEVAARGVLFAADHPEDQPTNLWDPADGPDGHDFGAHGPFDDRALAHSPQQWASQHRRAVAVSAGLAALTDLARRAG